MHVMGRCVQQADGPPEEVEEYFRRALHLKVAVQARKDCNEDPQVNPTTDGGLAFQPRDGGRVILRAPLFLPVFAAAGCGVLTSMLLLLHGSFRRWSSAESHHFTAIDCNVPRFSSVVADGRRIR